MGFFRWLYPGLRIKRWVFLSAFGIILCSMGFVLTVLEAQERSGSLFVVIGICLVVMSMRKIIKSVVTVLVPVSEKSLVGRMYQRGVLDNGPRIVAIGGGTGLSVLLKGLKERTSNLTAIVTVSDDGGSSGRLRSQFNVLPPGDIRNCLVALADADAETMMRDLFQYRFDRESSDLSGHNFGNLFLLAMTQITGDFDRAIYESSKILNIRGRVVPSTHDSVTLVARHQDGQVVEGETNIAEYPHPIENLYTRPGNLKPNQGALDAIQNADAIVLGPGSLYTSILPNLLIRELLEQVVRAQVPKIYVCNIMTQTHETGHLKTDYEHVKALIRATDPEILTHCVVNNAQVPETMVESYSKEGSQPIRLDSAKIEAMGYGVIASDLSIADNVMRHNPRKLAKIVADLAQRQRSKNGLSVKKRRMLPKFLTIKPSSHRDSSRKTVEKHLR